MYTTTSKQQEGCTCKDSHPKCFMTTNISTAKLSPGTVNRGDVHVLRESYAKVNSNTVRKYFDFIFDVTDYRLPYGNCSISFSPRSGKIT